MLILLSIIFTKTACTCAPVSILIKYDGLYAFDTLCTTYNIKQIQKNCAIRLGYLNASPASYYRHLLFCFPAEAVGEHIDVQGTASTQGPI